MSDDEIKLDLQQQRFEKAIAKELELTSEIIKKTGVFNQIDKLYGDIEDTEKAEGEEGGITGDMMGGSEESSPPMPPPLAAPETAAPPPPSEEGPEAAAESFKIEKDLPLILENKGIHLPDFELMSKKQI